jgi:glyoxylase-like metal-dependent hydrolase (beta-lactamase superfamily II)
VTTTTYTIRALNTGYQQLDKAQYATFRKGAGTIIEHPVFCFLIEGGGRRILVDTGMSHTEQSVRFHHQGRQDAGQAIHEQLAAVGLTPADIDIVIFTHLHWDHCYNAERFAKARLVVSEIEYQFALDPTPPYWMTYEHPSSGLTPPWQGLHFDLVQGEEEIVEGIRVLPTPGHSPGHQSVLVRTADGVYLIAGDLFFVRENLLPDAERGWPLSPIGRFSNFVELWRSMEHALRRADHVLMTHDPTINDRQVYPPAP